ITLSLVLDIHSPSDGLYRDWKEFRQAWKDVEYNGGDDLLDKRYKYSYIRLTNPDKPLPEVPCISEQLDLQADFDNDTEEYRRNIHPCSQVALTLTKVPRLRHLVWRYREPSVYFPLRRIMRQELVEYLETLRLGSSISTFEFYVGSRWYVHFHRLPNLVFPHEHDHLSLALHRLIATGENLRSVTYNSQLDPSFFWPYSTGDKPSQPFWPKVKELNVHFNYRGPNGKWYLQAKPLDYYEDGEYDINNEDYDEPNVSIHDGDVPLPPDEAGHMPPGYSSVQETLDAVRYERSLSKYKANDGTFNGSHEFRTVSNILPLLAAFARALAQMPCLEYAELSRDLESSGETKNGEERIYCPGPGYWSVFYCALGRNVYWDKYMEGGANLSAPRVFFLVEGWRPSKEVLNVFREVGRRHSGQDTVITFLPWQFFLW
ncbi:hypothetical protein QBC38DRAFT_520499, partial [Podospora fimiseda]